MNTSLSRPDDRLPLPPEILDVRAFELRALQTAAGIARANGITDAEGVGRIHDVVLGILHRRKMRQAAQRQTAAQALGLEGQRE